MSRVTLLIILKLSRRINNYPTFLHQHASKSTARHIIVDHTSFFPNKEGKGRSCHQSTFSILRSSSSNLHSKQLNSFTSYTSEGCGGFHKALSAWRYLNYPQREHCPCLCVHLKVAAAAKTGAVVVVGVHLTSSTTEIHAPKGGIGQATAYNSAQKTTMSCSIEATQNHNWRDRQGERYPGAVFSQTHISVRLIPQNGKSAVQQLSEPFGTEEAVNWSLQHHRPRLRL